MAHKKAGLGWLRDLPDPRDHLFSVSLSILQSLPNSVDITPDFSPYDQGQIGSCNANALAGAIQFDRQKTGQTPDFIPSRLFIYYNERAADGKVAIDSGAYLREGIKTLQQQGVCPESEWPYDATPPTTEGGAFPIGSRAATTPSQTCYNDAINYTITTYQSLTQTLSQLQGCLASGFPFVFGFSVFSSWYDNWPPTTVVPLPTQSDSMIGGHAVLCVGYDNDKNLFKIRNSWGPAVGDGGYFYMPCAYVTDPNLSADFWVINAVKD